MNQLILKKDGVLLLKNGRNKLIEDVSEIAVYHLNDQIVFDDVTLRDLFLLINKNMFFFQPIFNNWIEKYTEKALATPRKSGTTQIEFLELLWSFNVLKDSADAPAWMGFHGVGGDEIYYSVAGVQIENIVDLPLQLRQEIEIWFEEEDRLIKQRTESFTLYQVIQSVIWELSFFGDPDFSQEKIRELFIQGSILDIDVSNLDASARVENVE